VIVKGASRSGPQQLAIYLMRVGRYDTGEPARLLELQSIRSVGVDARDRERTAAQLIEVFRDWQSAVEGTQRGRDGLYHLEISPAPEYAAKMTKEEWLHSVDLAGEELGLAGQPRAVVLHGGKDGRQHLHAVWQRTDIETMKVISDSYNYIAHEKASQRMELEFGMEIVPGKHAKRDRKKQPEFPRQKLSQDEDQYQKRTGLSKEDRVKEITAMRAAADSGAAFKAALEDAGYLLAKGDRGYIVVDERGGHSVLSRNAGLKKDEVEAFMAGVALDKLPTIEEAKALQAERRNAETVSKSDGQAAPEQQPEKKGVEASKFLQPRTADKALEPSLVSAQGAGGQPQPGAETEAAKKAGQRKPEPVDPERKQQIIALRAWADGAQAFRKALEEAGYTLARGNTGYVLFSKDGVFSLARHAGLPKAKLHAFMSPIPLASLPEVDNLIEARKQQQPQSKFLPPEIEAPLPSSLPPKDTVAARMEISTLDMAAEAIAEAQKRQAPDPELEALQKAMAKRQEEEAAALRERHEAELRAKEVEMDRYIARDMENYKRIQSEQTEAFLQARQEQRSGIKGIIEAIENRWNPALREARAKEREQERRNFYRRLAKERADYEVLILQTKQQEMENLIERQAQQFRDQRQEHREEAERRILEHEEAKRIRAEIEADETKRKQLEKDESLKDRPPDLGK
jgi:MobA/VirD2-like, nuclease domain